MWLPSDTLQHSRGPWKKHKYTAIKNGRYIYADQLFQEHKRHADAKKSAEQYQQQGKARTQRHYKKYGGDPNKSEYSEKYYSQFRKKGSYDSDKDETLWRSDAYFERKRQKMERAMDRQDRNFVSVNGQPLKKGAGTYRGAVNAKSDYIMKNGAKNYKANKRKKVSEGNARKYLGKTTTGYSGHASGINADNETHNRYSARMAQQNTRSTKAKNKGLNGLINRGKRLVKKALKKLSRKKR